MPQKGNKQYADYPQPSKAHVTDDYLMYNWTYNEVVYHQSHYYSTAHSKPKSCFSRQYIRYLLIWEESSSCFESERQKESLNANKDDN